jgi:hypothetical protein
VFLVLAILTFSVCLGLWAKCFGLVEQLLLIGCIAAAIAVQYFVLGPS